MTPPTPADANFGATSQDSEAFGEFDVPDWTENPEAIPEGRLFPEGLLDEEYRPSRRRWPAVLAFILAGSAVSVIGIAAVMHYRHLGPTNPAIAEPAGGQRNEQTAPGCIGSTAPATAAASATSQPAERPPVEPPSTDLGSRSAQPKTVAEAPAPAAPVAESPELGTSAPSKSAKSGVRSATPRRAVRHQPARGARDYWERQAQPDHGVPVHEVYVNGRGELVDAQGNPLPRRTPPAQGSAPNGSRPRWTPQEP